MGCCKQNLWLCSPPNIRICLWAIWKKTFTLIHLLVLGKTAWCSPGQEGNSPSVTGLPRGAGTKVVSSSCPARSTKPRMALTQPMGCLTGPCVTVTSIPRRDASGWVKEHRGNSQPHGVRCSWKRVLLSKEDIVFPINWSVFSL